MKKILSLLAVCALFGMTSCKKDYTCECTIPGAGTTTAKYEKVTKKDAEKACDAASATAAVAGGSCKLK